MRRGRFLKSLEERVTIRRKNDDKPFGQPQYDIIDDSVKCIVSLLTPTSSQNADPRSGINLTDRRCYAHFNPRNANVRTGDEIIRHDLQEDSFDPLQATAGYLQVVGVETQKRSKKQRLLCLDVDRIGSLTN